jgi:hypothetical protein
MTAVDPPPADLATTARHLARQAHALLNDPDAPADDRRRLLIDLARLESRADHRPDTPIGRWIRRLALHLRAPQDPRRVDENHQQAGVY